MYYIVGQVEFLPHPNNGVSGRPPPPAEFLACTIHKVEEPHVCYIFKIQVI